MKKRIKLISLILALVMMLSACTGNQNANNPNSEKDPMQQDDPIKQDDSAPQDNPIKQDDPIKNNDPINQKQNIAEVAMTEVIRDCVGFENNLNVSIDYGEDTSYYHNGTPRSVSCTVSGLRDKTVEKKINDRIASVIEAFGTNKEYIPPFVGSKLHGTNVSYCDCSVSSVLNRDNVLSLEIIVTRSVGNGYNIITFAECIPLNFDLRTGVEIKVTDLFESEEEGLYFLDTFVKNYIKKNNALDELDETAGIVLNDFVQFSSVPKSFSKDQRFELNGNENALYLIFDYHNPEVACNDSWGGGQCFRKMRVPLDGVVNLGVKFASSENLFEDETKSAILLNYDFTSPGIESFRNIDGMMGDEIKIDAINGVIYGEYVYVQGKNFTQEQNKFLNLGDEYESFKNQMVEFVQADENKHYAVDQSFFFNIHSSSDIVGKYLCLSRSKSYTGDDYKGNSRINHIEEEGRTYLYGTDTLLGFQDIFIGDYKSILRDAMFKSIRYYEDELRSYGNEIEDITGDKYLAYIDELLKDVHGFTLTNNGITIYVNDVESKLRTIIPELQHTWVATGVTRNITFEYIGYENLNPKLLEE